MKEKQEIIYKNVKDLIPYVNNTRTHDEKQVKQIAASIKEFGFTNPVLVGESNDVIAGHGRILAAEKLGIGEVPTIELKGLSEAQKKAYIIADNKLALNAGWDEDLLKIELEGLKELDFDLSVIGFNSEELDDLLKTEQDEVVEDDFEVELPKEPKSKLGDVYKLGIHRLMCGDSTDHAVVEALMDRQKADLFLTDPPYNVDYQGGTKEKLKIQNDKMSNDGFKQFLIDAFAAADSVMKEGSSFYIWHADSEGYNFRGACDDAGWKVRQCLIWVKSSIVLRRQDYQWKHEPCLYGWKDGSAHFWRGGRKERTTITGFDLFELRSKKKEELLKFIEEIWCDKEDYETSIIFNDKPSANREHLTMKPIKLLARQIKNSTKESALVLDTFGGSGSTLMACEQLNRSCYMMELDPKYIDVIINRWEQFTGEKAVLLK